MSLHRSVAAGLWLMAAVAAYAVVVAWADDAQSGKLPPWTLVVLFWSVALVSATIHHLSDFLTGHLPGLPHALKRHGLRWSLAVGQQARRLGSLAAAGARAAGRPAARMVMPRLVPAAGAVPVDRAGAIPSGEVPSWTMIVMLQAACGVSAAVNRLRRGWRQLGPAVGLFIGKLRLLRPAGGQSAALAARLGSFIGVR
jgi:hypothetical protein